MPKIDGTQVGARLQVWLDKLKSGDAVAARDLRALLTDEQEAAMDAAWAEQLQLRTNKKPKTLEAQVAIGWKEKRDIHIEALQQAIEEATGDELAAWEKRVFDSEVRQGRIYIDELGAALDEGKDKQVAKNRANNALTRAGLRRLAGQQIGMQGLTPRDRELRAMEDAIQQRAESEMDDYEREQLELAREYEKAVTDKFKKRR